MRYMLDTCICIEAVRKPTEALVRRILVCKKGSEWLSAISLAELAYGVEKSGRHEENLERLESFCMSLEIAPFGWSSAFHYARIRNDLRTRGMLIGPLDMLIAAQALAADCTLVINNEREFRRVSGLRVENWLAA